MSTVSARAATKVVATHNTSKTLTFRGASYVNLLCFSKVSNRNFFTYRVLRSRINTNLTKVTYWLYTELCKVTSHWFVNVLFLDRTKTKLNCFITIRLSGLNLANLIRSCLNYRNRYNYTVFGENLSHTNLSTVDSVNHLVSHSPTV